MATPKEETSVEWVCRKHPERVVKLFAALDLERKGLEQVKSATGKKDFPAACRELLKYYRRSDSGKWLRKKPPEPGNRTDPSCEKMLKDTFTFQCVEGKAPRLKSGGLKWTYRGPEKDKEWAWALNRQFHLKELMDAYFKTGNIAYVRRIDEHVRDWVTSSPYPGKRNSTPQWRGLEVYFRVVHWADIFYGLQQVNEFTPAARILMLSAMPDHAHYNKHFHAAGSNWIAMEMHGLATAGVCWPEFADADAWTDYAVKRMLTQITRQLYPDGVQKELTSHYHWVALKAFQRFADVLRQSGRNLPTEFAESLEKMWNYLAYSIRPDGHGPLNNDSDRDFNRQRVLDASKRYKRPDWTYIAANGRKGKKPKGQPTIIFPWAGQIIMRSGWDAGAHWALFDAGPLGISHWHYDKLHLSVAAYGRDLLVDGGRYTYKSYGGGKGTWREYFIGSASHNVILIDGHGQNPGRREARKPLKKDSYAIEPAFDYARGVFDKGFKGIKGKVVHTRAVLYVRGKFWVVVDRVTTDKPRDIQVLWHYHPACTVAVQDGTITSTDAGKGNLRIVPASDLPWKLEIVKGREKPSIQGWYSVRYNVKEPNPTAVYSAKIEKTTTFAWILVPAKGAVPQAKAEIVSESDGVIRISVSLPRAKPVIVTVPLKEGKPGIEKKGTGRRASGRAASPGRTQ